jgi:DNA-binding FadR family transcriptional regulator
VKAGEVPGDDTVPRRRSIAAHSYLRLAEQIRTRILDGQLKPGDRLPNENELARLSGVGRTTVREALRLLASERLIETRRGVQGGAFVTHPNSADLDEAMMTALRLMTMTGELTHEELMDASEVLQTAHSQLATARATDAEADELIELGKALAAAKSDEEWVELGRAYNTRLAELTRNRILAVFIRSLLWITPERYREGRLQPGWRKATGTAYQRLAEAIRSRDPAAVEAALAHLRETYAPVMRIGASRT